MDRTKQNILNFMIALNNEEYAKADRYIGNALLEKAKQRYSKEYEKIKKEYKKDK